MTKKVLMESLISMFVHTLYLEPLLLPSFRPALLGRVTNLVGFNAED